MGRTVLHTYLMLIILEENLLEKIGNYLLVEKIIGMRNGLIRVIKRVIRTQLYVVLEIVI